MQYVIVLEKTAFLQWSRKARVGALHVSSFAMHFATAEWIFMCLAEQ